MPLKVLEPHSEAEKDHLANLCESDLESIEELLRQGVRSSSSLPKELGQRLILSGGKRIRPYLLCLTYHTFKARDPHRNRVSALDLHTLAAVAEWVHTATLFHDDVLDASPSRRDQPAAHILHGNKVAILVGDFVYAEAFALLMDRGHLDPSRELAATIKNVVEGELLQHQVCMERSVSLTDYTRIAKAKTGALFGWCTGTGCWAAGSELTSLAKDFGCYLGEAFQMADDLFDTFSIDPKTADLATLTEWIESSAPLPVVLAAENDPRVQSLWADLALTKGTESKRTLVREVLNVCRQESIVTQSLKWIQSLLTQAESARVKLGGNPTLKTALDMIEARALQGASFAGVTSPRSNA